MFLEALEWNAMTDATLQYKHVACHKGFHQPVSEAIADAVTLVNTLSTISTGTLECLTNAFKSYKDQRMPIAKAAVEQCGHLRQVFTGKVWCCQRLISSELELLRASGMLTIQADATNFAVGSSSFAQAECCVQLHARKSTKHARR